VGSERPSPSTVSKRASTKFIAAWKMSPLSISPILTACGVTTAPRICFI
jgi:hypothetical protein